MHSPDHSVEAAEARKLGGLRRRREKTLAVAYDFEGLRTSESIERIIEIATLDALGLENSIARCRVLIAAASAASRLLEVGELEARLACSGSGPWPGARWRRRSRLRAGSRAMTLKRRVEALEASLSPPAWSCAGWGRRTPSAISSPMWPRYWPSPRPGCTPRSSGSGSGTRGPDSHAGQAARAGDAAVRSALRETIFRFELVMRINVTVHDLVDREALIDAALSAQVALVTSEQKREPKDLVWLGQL